MVHEDLRQPLHDGLYVERLKDEGRRGELWPRLSSHSPPLLVTLLDPVLVALGDALDRGGEAAAAAGGARVLRDKVATAALKACVAVLERLLLDGGRSRSFSTTDAPALLADVRLVRDFFMAMDSRRVAQGLEELSVHEATARLQGLVLMMHRDTADLGNDFHRDVEPFPDVSPTEALTRYNLARVLLHRVDVDEAAREFVKTNRLKLRDLVAKYDALSY